MIGSSAKNNKMWETPLAGYRPSNKDEWEKATIKYRPILKAVQYYYATEHGYNSSAQVQNQDKIE